MNGQDEKQTGIIDLSEFDKVCLNHKIGLSKEELQLINRLFGEDDRAYDDTLNSGNKSINYKRLSYYLGLHKDSFNYLSNSQSNLRKLTQMRDRLASLEPDTNGSVEKFKKVRQYTQLSAQHKKKQLRSEMNIEMP